MLTAKQVRDLKPAAKVYTKTDGGGLELQVKTSGARFWRFRFRHEGKQQILHLGPFPELGLKEARERRDDARRLLRSGVNPRDAKQQEQQAEQPAATLDDVAQEWFALKKSGWVAAHYNRRIQQYNLWTKPALGQRPVDDLTSSEIFEFLKVVAVTGGKAETARKLRGDLEHILGLAIVKDLVRFNAASGLSAQLPRPKTQNFPAITEPRAFGAFLLALKTLPDRTYIQTRIAAQIAPHLALRPSELVGARWSEIELGDSVRWEVPNGVWIIPGKRMKEGRDLVVPLSHQVAGLLDQLHVFTRNNEFVFPAARKPETHLHIGSLEQVFKRLGFAGKQCPHGLRASFRTMAAEELNEDERYLEMQVGHVVKDANGTAYNRTAFLKQRVGVMQRWSNYLDKIEKAAKRKAN
jgi:integrase